MPEHNNPTQGRDDSFRSHRKYTTTACTACKQAKTKCDGRNPCRRCVEKGHTSCEYGHDARSRATQKLLLETAESKGELLDRLVSGLRISDDEQSQNIVSLLRRNGSLDEMSQLLTSQNPEMPSSSHNENPTEPSSATALEFNSHPRSSTETTAEGSLSPYVEDNADHDQSAEYIFRNWRLSHRNVGDVKFTLQGSQVPSEKLVRKCATFFFEDTAKLFFVITTATFDILCTQAFSSKNKAINPALGEVCAVAAVGAQYHPRDVPEVEAKALFDIALQYLGILIQGHTLNTLRTIACLGSYGILEKSRDSRSLIALGLRLSRWEAGKSSISPRHLERLHQTFIFLECWLSAASGHEADISETEIALSLASLRSAEGDDINDINQQKLAQIALIKLQIQRQCRDPSAQDPISIERRMDILDQWHSTLPAGMNLSKLTMESQPLIWGQQGTLFLAHTMYLGSVIILHRNVLLIAIRNRMDPDAQPADLDKTRAMQYEMRMETASRFILRLFMLLGVDNEPTNWLIRCWLSLYEMFIASAVLLYSIAIKSDSTPSDDAELTSEDLHCVTSCAKLFKTLATVDKTAKKLHNMMVDLFHHVEDGIVKMDVCPKITRALQSIGGNLHP